jgi:hypothetical protein
MFILAPPRHLSYLQSEMERLGSGDVEGDRRSPFNDPVADQVDAALTGGQQ